MKIHKLPENLINKIAAGEVVERPASIVKELVENSIDAGASSVEVILLDGGRKSITVIDNGSGMRREDLPLSIERHATSKISQDEDLFRIETLGFRGEALASIAAVSRLSIRTHHDSEEVGSMLRVDGGKMACIVDDYGPKGTAVSVDDLFFNIPARKAFLKNAAYEFGACQDVLKHLALSHPQVAMTLQHQGKTQFFCPKLDFASEGQDAWVTQTLTRARDLLGLELTERLIPVHKTSRIGSVHALVSPPGASYGHSRHIYCFLNGRPIKDKVMRFAIVRGFHSHLLKGRYPLAIVNLECDPSLVDVNVHPAKTEVRFQYVSELQSMVAQAIRDAIREGQWSAPPSSTGAQMPASMFFAETREPILRAEFRPPVWSPPRQEFSRPPAVVAEAPQEAIPWNELRFLGCFASCHLIFEHQERLLLIDQHAFHERIIYERLMKSVKGAKLDSQTLLIEESIRLAPHEWEVLERSRVLLENFGFQFATPTDQNTVGLLGVPVILQHRPADQILTSLLEEMSELDLSGDEISERGLHDVFATMACHSAVRAGEDLPEHELQHLLNEASAVDFYLNCPHGRPVFKWWERSQVDSWFDR